ncbi:hypothetical protein PPL_08556 [Heterostelium album PN500]|uniref:Purple acid phosphatase n=1 Tax=Heterostelium pallidum (strain ATCC 26659 / Pp 5 / PN500) TaxID=670386 RepID=D3BJ35_HETP5|nr:hypothetical protein PPL_08556 [Heterostelium album PN500]EFA77915.1 hypothetical protein PPL_08556 [Heterostelium album PN500]|eukprot:XP_020430043.1 hypothetical protein PPL_08556 [Heterostelium album PN500]
MTRCKIVVRSQNVLPNNVNLAFTTSQSEMRATWYTVNQTVGAVRFSSQQFSADTADSVDMSLSPSTFTEYGEFPGWSGFVNTAVMSNLNALQQYFYQVGDSQQNLWSPVYNFTTGAGATTFKPFSFNVFGDMGGGDYMDTVHNLLENTNRFDWTLHVGDIAYADYSEKDLESGNTKSHSHSHSHVEGGLQSGMLGNMTVWNEFMKSITPLSSMQSYMVCIGNHDVFYNKSAYSASWLMPSESPAQTWYAFDYNGVHFVAISTENSYTYGSEQYTWLENHLQQFRESNPDTWLIAYAHRPFYCTSIIMQWCYGNHTGALFNTYDPLFQKYNVDIFIAGHTHAYERTYPVYENKVMGSFEEPKGTVYIAVGVGGNWEGLDPLFDPFKPEWSAHRHTYLGYGILNVVNQTHINWEFNRAIDNKVSDSFWMNKGTFLNYYIYLYINTNCFSQLNNTINI